MMFDVVATGVGVHAIESLEICALTLPWTGWFSTLGGLDFERRLRVPRPKPHEDYRPFWAEYDRSLSWPRAQGRWLPDPASDGTSHLRVRRSFEWFVFEDDGTCREYPLLGGISILRTTRFDFADLPGLHDELVRVLPHLHGNDELLFDLVAFLAEEVLAVGAGAIEFRPGMMG